MFKKLDMPHVLPQVHTCRLNLLLGAMAAIPQDVCEGDYYTSLRESRIRCKEYMRRSEDSVTGMEYVLTMEPGTRFGPVEAVDYGDDTSGGKFVAVRVPSTQIPELKVWVTIWCRDNLRGRPVGRSYAERVTRSADQG